MNMAAEKTTLSVQKNQNRKRTEDHTVAEEKACCLKEKKQKTETRPWADLHEDLLRIITHKFRLYDRVRLRLVCKDWRTKIAGTEPTNSLPWMFRYEWCKSDRDHKLTLEGILVEPYSRKHHPIKYGKCWKSSKMSLFYDARPCASKHGWLLFAKGLRKNGTSFFLYNPFSNDFKLLPLLSSTCHCDAAAFSKNPTCPDSVVFASYRVGREIYMATYTFGEENWTTTQVVVRAEEWQRVLSMVYSVEKDELYCLFWGAILAKFEVVGRRWSLLKQPRLYDSTRKPETLMETLMEYKGQLVLVTNKDVNRIFQIYRFDWSLMDWIVLDSLGNGAIILHFDSSPIAVEEASSSKDFTCCGDHRTCFSLKICYTILHYSYEPMRVRGSGTVLIQL